MTYQGSKAKYSKYIVPILDKVIKENNIDTFVDCCCGGCNIITNVTAPHKIGIDLNKNWIAFLQKLADGTFQIPEELPSMEMWEDCKYNENCTVDPAMIGFIGVFCAYRAAGYYKSGHIHGAVGEKQYRGRCNTLKKELHKYPGIEFISDSYSKIKDFHNCVIYIDPPYVRGQHEYDVGRDFDYADFWQTVREASKDNYVFVSEQEAPEDFEVIWELIKDTKVFGKDTRIEERLYHYKDGK